MRHLIIILLSMLCFYANASTIRDMPRFEQAILIIKHFEGMHGKKDHPYVGYGHRILPGEKLSWNMSKKEADALLRADLYKLVYHFREYKEYALLLAVLAYNVGPYAITGNSKRPPSNLIKKIRAGRHDIRANYLDFCRWNGRKTPQIQRRRWTELYYLAPYA